MKQSNNDVRCRTNQQLYRMVFCTNIHRVQLADDFQRFCDFLEMNFFELLSSVKTWQCSTSLISYKKILLYTGLHSIVNSWIWLPAGYCEWQKRIPTGHIERAGKWPITDGYFIWLVPIRKWWPDVKNCCMGSHFFKNLFNLYFFSLWHDVKI